MEYAKNVKNFNKLAMKNIEKNCEVCKAGFEAWMSTLNFSEEREEKMRSHFLKYCPECRLLSNNED